MKLISERALQNNTKIKMASVYNLTVSIEIFTTNSKLASKELEVGSGKSSKYKSLNS